MRNHVVLIGLLSYGNLNHRNGILIIKKQVSKFGNKFMYMYLTLHQICSDDVVLTVHETLTINFVNSERKLPGKMMQPELPTFQLFGMHISSWWLQNQSSTIASMTSVRMNNLSKDEIEQKITYTKWMSIKSGFGLWKTSLCNLSGRYVMQRFFGKFSFLYICCGSGSLRHWILTTKLYIGSLIVAINELTIKI